MNSRAIKHIGMAAALSAAAMLTSCFTGVESTPKITAGDVKRANVRTSPESTFLADISGEPASKWAIGKQFYVTDTKINSVFGTPSAQTGDLTGTMLTYTGSEPVTTIVGDPATDFIFTDRSGNRLRYRSVDATRSDTASFDVPFTIQMSVVEEVARRLNGKRYYVLTPIWYDRDGQSYTGRKFIPVEVAAVAPGNNVYPLSLLLRTDDGAAFILFMSVGSNLRAPRGFATLFSFTDPREKYPQISDETWANIIRGRVALGMTRAECRLALGTPDDVIHRNDHNYLYERWNYDNGVYLVFRDDILENYRY